MPASDLVVVSNRGPISFARDETGELVPRRGAGGIVSSLGPLLSGTDSTWIAAAVSDDDREAARLGLMGDDSVALRPVSIEPAIYRMAYDVVSNATLWFVHHGLFDLAHRPLFDRRWRQAWDAYVAVNRSFAETVAEAAPPGATVLVQDYHLALVGSDLAEVRPDLRCVHFSHTPFAGPDGLGVLPDGVAEAILEGMAACVACGFHSRRWATRFEQSCAEILGRVPTTFVAPLGVDPDALAAATATPACAEEAARLEKTVGGRRLIVRVDRIELSKNLLRGFLAFDELLRAHPEHRGNVVMLAIGYPSREGLPEYIAYRTEVEAMAERLNTTWGTDTWTPIVLELSDNYPRSVAALTRYDVLLVNPISDGLNLVAKEGPVVNRRHGILVLSRQAGAWDEMAETAISFNPFDVAATADALHRALDLGPEEAAVRAEATRRAASARTARHWLEDQLAASAGQGGQ
jgi:trehalose 6-phosphate synthase